MGQADRGRGACRDDDALIVDGDDGVDGCAPVERDHGGDAGLDVAEGDHDGAVVHRVGHGLALLGRHDHLGAQRPGRGNEVRGAVGRGGQQEKNPGHGPIMVRGTGNPARVRSEPPRSHHRAPQTSDHWDFP